MAIDTIKFKRGVKSKLNNLSYGEPAYISDEHELYIGAESGVKKITSNKEVAELNSKLEDEKITRSREVSELSSQLEHNTNEIKVLKPQVQSLASGSPKGVYDTFDELQTAFPSGNKNIYIVSADGGWYYWNGSAWTNGGVYQSIGIAQKSISVNHLTYFASEGIPSKNLFDKDTLTSGYLNNGYISKHNSKWVSDYIECLPNEDYIATNECYNTGGDINFFDENKGFISQITNTNNTYFTTPPNAKYIRVTVRTEWISFYQLELGRIRTSYTTHYPKTKIDDESIGYKKLNFDFPKISYGKNLYNKETSIVGKYIDYRNGKLSDNALYCASDYIEIDNELTYFMRHPQQFAFYDENKNFISGVIDGNIISPVQNSKYVRVSTLLTRNDTQQIEVGTEFTNYEDFCKVISDDYKVRAKNILGIDIPKDIINITVSTNDDGDFSNIQNAIDNCTDKTKIYNIFIKNGTYNEVNISIKQNNINLIGENVDKTIIYSNGATVEGEVRDKHCLDVCCDSKIENITFIGENTKYTIHQDFNNSQINNTFKYSAYFKNCIFIKKTSDYHVTGFGCRAGQNNYFDNCKFIYENGDIERYGILWHNWNNQSSGCELHVKNCEFINCSPFHISELGSNHTDNIYIENIRCNLKTGGIFFTCNGQYYIPNGSSMPLGTEGDYTTVPYNIKINLNSNINKYEVDDTRPLHKPLSEGNYTSIGKNKKNSVIKKGYAISTDYTNLLSGRNAICIIENGELCGVALEDIPQNSMGNYVLPKKCCHVFASADSYAINNMLKSNIDGSFSKTTNVSEAIAIVLEAKTLSVDGLVKALLI